MAQGGRNGWERGRGVSCENRGGLFRVEWRPPSDDGCCPASGLGRLCGGQQGAGEKMETLALYRAAVE